MSDSYTPEDLARAAEFAAEHHKGQVDKAGDPYLFHLHRVSAAAYKEYGLRHAIVGMLHDVVEDTDATFVSVASVFDGEIARAVEVLTRRRDDTYVEYINRVATLPVASQVKRLDLADNLSRMYNLSDDEQVKSLKKRYVMAFDALDDAAIKGSYR